MTETQRDEWDDLLARRLYWSTIRVAAWALRYANNSLAKRRGQNKRSGPLTMVEITTARNHLVWRSQKNIQEDLRGLQFKWTKDDDTGILKCEGRIASYKPMYLENEEFITKLIQHVHKKNNHLGVAHTMASIREEWWIPRLRSRVKKYINNCNVCKVFSTKPYGATETAALPTFRTEVSRPF